MEAVETFGGGGDGVDGGGGGGRRGGSLRRQERMQGAIDDDGGGVIIPAARRIDAGIFAVRTHCNASNLIGLVRKRLPAPLHFLSSLSLSLVGCGSAGSVGGPATVWPSYQASHFPAFQHILCRPQDTTPMYCSTTQVKVPPLGPYHRD